MDGIVMNNQQNNTNYYELESVAQHSMKECFGEPLIGLQFVVEIRKNLRDKSDVYFLCAFCAMKLNTTTLLAHIKSVRHKMKFCETFIPSLFSKFGDQNRNWIASEYKELNEELTRFRKYEGPKKLAVTEQADQRNAIKFLKYLIKSSSPPDYHNRGHRITSDDRLNSSLDRNIPHPRADEQLYGSSSDHSNVESKRMPQGSKGATLLNTKSSIKKRKLEEMDNNGDASEELSEIEELSIVPQFSPVDNLLQDLSIQRLVKSDQSQSSEESILLLKKSFIEILKSQLKKNSYYPQVKFLSNDPEMKIILNFISNKINYSHPTLRPRGKQYVMLKEYKYQVNHFKSTLNMLLIHADNMYSKIKNQPEKLLTMNRLLICPIVKLIDLLVETIQNIRHLFIPYDIPTNIRKPLINAPLRSEDIWDVDEQIIEPVVSMVASAELAKGIYRQDKNRKKVEKTE